MNNGVGGGAPEAGALVNLDSGVLLAGAGIKQRDFKGTPGLWSRTAGPCTVSKTALSPLRTFKN